MSAPAVRHRLADAADRPRSWIACGHCLTPLVRYPEVETGEVAPWMGCPTHGPMIWRADGGTLDLGVVR